MTTSMHRVTAAVCVCGVVMTALHRRYMVLVDRDAAASPSLTAGVGKSKKKKKKPAMGLGESLKFLAQSEYLACLAVMVLS